jgi:hypothetical protein
MDEGVQAVCYAGFLSGFQSVVLIKPWPWFSRRMRLAGN